jgi:hypothetical protein
MPARSLVLPLILIIAAPVAAETASQKNRVLSSSSAPALGSNPAVKGESPLVRAANASRENRKTAKIVITQDTVRTSTGVLTTTTNAYMPTIVPEEPAKPSTAEQQRAARREAELIQQQQREAKKKSLEQEFRRAAADYYDESEDPAAADPDYRERRLHEIPNEAKSLDNPPS